jgi:PAS domain S-box-containing protein
MLQKLSEQVQACLERAFEAERKAWESADPALKADFLQMEKRWRALAQSYQFTERLTDFTGANADWRRRFDERRRVEARQDDEPRLQKIIQEGDVTALFDRMWLASIVEFSDDAIISKTVNGIITSWNKGAERLFGYSAEEVIGKSITIVIPPERHGEEDAILKLIRRGDHIEHYETVRQRKDGSLIDISLTISPIRGAAGKIVGASKIARDISERKRIEAQVSVLAREAEHRAKNLLANVGAMVQLSQADTPDDLKKVIAGRIAALAGVHSLFAQSRWAGAELGALVKQELSPYSSRERERRTRIDGPAVMLKPDVAQVMAVVLHELATNAVKYGSLSVGEGQVRVEWSRSADGQVVLRWTEAGGPPVEPPTRKGFGTHMVDAMIRGHEGDVRLNWHADGLACEITLPT